MASEPMTFQEWSIEEHKRYQQIGNKIELATIQSMCRGCWQAAQSAQREIDIDAVKGVFGNDVNNLTVEIEAAIREQKGGGSDGN